MRTQSIFRALTVIAVTLAISFSAYAQTTKPLPSRTTTSHVAVKDITGVPTTATAGTPLTLTGTVNPANATNKAIAWSVVSAGTTGAKISGVTLTTTAAGTVTVLATIPNGASATANYTQKFTITVSAAATSGTLSKPATQMQIQQQPQVQRNLAPAAAFNENLKKVEQELKDNGHFQILNTLVVLKKSPYDFPLNVKLWNPDTKLTWASNKSDVVAVDDGYVTAKAVGGPVTITATNEKGHKEQCQVYVVQEFISGKTAIGMGIDITTAQAFTFGQMKTSPVFEMDIIKARQLLGESKLNTPTEFNTESGKTVTETIKSFNNKTTVSYTGAFSAKADVSYSSTTSSKRTSAYTRSQAQVRTRDEFLKEKNLNRLKEYITDNFKEDLAKRDAAYMINIYGSHVIAQCYYGGMVQLDFSIASLEKTSFEDIKVQVEAKAYGVGVKNTTGFQNQQKEFSENSSLKIFNDGGILEALNLEQFQSNFKKWETDIRNGVTKSSLCGFHKFDEQETMFPIWEIAKLINPAKATAIKAEFDKKIADSEIKLNNLTQYVKNVYLGHHGNSLDLALSDLKKDAFFKFSIEF